MRAARTAAGSVPSDERVARVRQKLADPDARLDVAERDGEVVGMLLAEPFREGGGAGDVRPGWEHISMVFVHPDHQGVGIGSELLSRLIGSGERSGFSVWTRATNEPAQGLYRSCGFAATGELGTVRGQELTQRWEWHP